MDTLTEKKLFAPVPAELHRRIKIRALEENRPLQDVVRDAVEEYLDRKKAAYG